MAEKKPKQVQWILLAAASQLAVLAAGGLLGGLWLDQKFSTTPLLGLIGLVMGFVSGGLFVARMLRTEKPKERVNDNS